MDKILFFLYEARFYLFVFILTNFVILWLQRRYRVRQNKSKIIKNWIQSIELWLSKQIIRKIPKQWKQKIKTLIDDALRVYNKFSNKKTKDLLIMPKLSILVNEAINDRLTYAKFIHSLEKKLKNQKISDNDFKQFQLAYRMSLIVQAESESKKVINQNAKIDNLKLVEKARSLDELQEIFSWPNSIINLLKQEIIKKEDTDEFVRKFKQYYYAIYMENSDIARAEYEILEAIKEGYETNSFDDTIQQVLDNFKNTLLITKGENLHNILEGFDKSIIPNNACLKKLVECMEKIPADTVLKLQEQYKKMVIYYTTRCELNVEKISDRILLKVTGTVVTLSEILKKIEKIFDGNSSIEEVYFLVHLFRIDCDLTNAQWHGKNVVIMAQKIDVIKEVKWNLSGIHGTGLSKNFPIMPLDGRDGIAGESGGNLYILTEELAQNLNLMQLISNGGNGYDGENGRDGSDGNNGIAQTYKYIADSYPSEIKITNNVLTDLLLPPLFNNEDVHPTCQKIRSDANESKRLVFWESKAKKKSRNFYCDATLTNGHRVIFSFSDSPIYSYWMPQAFLIYKGTPGEKGEIGGSNGKGGERGFQGTMKVISKKGIVESYLIPMFDPHDGENGKDGTVGKNGEWGLPGEDVAYISTVQYTGCPKSA